MAQVYSVATGTTEQADVDAVVYVVSSRDGTYKHTMHRVRRLAHDIAVTYCTIWTRGGMVKAEQDDCAVWCEYGCKPFVAAE
jgi:hypothetical protein